VNRTVAAIYVTAENKQLLQARITELKQTVRNCGCTISGTAVYSDLKSLMADAQAHKFQVLYLNYAYVLPADIKSVRNAVSRLYAYGLSAIVCK